LFIQELGRFNKIVKDEYRLFNQSFLKKLFRPNTNTSLVEKFIEFGKDMSWAIVPYNLLHIFYDSEKLNFMKDENEKIIYHLGSIAHIDVYINPDDESGEIFFGNYESLIILANKYMDIYETNQGVNYNFQYLFIQQGEIRSLKVT
jgi:hypothetical protein